MAISCAGAGVDQDVVVHLVAGGAQFAGDAGVTTEGGDAHGVLPVMPI
jgi:hypothetical protein